MVNLESEEHPQQHFMKIYFLAHVVTLPYSSLSYNTVHGVVLHQPPLHVLVVIVHVLVLGVVVLKPRWSTPARSCLIAGCGVAAAGDVGSVARAARGLLISHFCLQSSCWLMGMPRRGSDRESFRGGPRYKGSYHYLKVQHFHILKQVKGRLKAGGIREALKKVVKNEQKS